MKSLFSYCLLVTLLCCLAACNSPQVPSQFSEAGTMPMIYPDYSDVTIPVNIAPLCFELMMEADEAVTRFTANGRELIVEGRKCRPDIDDWHSLVASACDKDITVEVFAAKDGRWVRFKPFDIHVSGDSIDPYLCYRLISPSYVSYEELTINERCLENFDECVIADNMLCSNESGGQCINCHNFQNYNPQRTQLHARQTHGGTIITYDGNVEKVNLSSEKIRVKSQQKSLPAVYPAWHPTEPFIAYSTNSTMQAFHTVDPDKIEVYDSQSTLALYDIEHHELTDIEHMNDELETYPSWSPDGRWLYYCSAHFEYKADSVDAEEITLRTRELKYNIYRRSFDSSTHSFGSRELVFDAVSLGMSAAHPRISPDGRWLLFSMSEYGTFHIWHHDADLWLMDLDSEELRVKSEEYAAAIAATEGTPVGNSTLNTQHSTLPKDSSLFTLNSSLILSAVNSNSAESYHSWSSNGRWIVFSSRRTDGVFTRPFFAHIDANGKGSKPFELPAKDPDLHRQLLKSYNVPEFVKGSVTFTPQQIASKLKEE